MYCGFDIGGSKMLGVAVDTGDTVWPFAVRREVTIECEVAIIDAIEKMVIGFENDCDTYFSAVGVGIAGIVDHRGVLRYSPNIEGVYNLEIQNRLEQRLRRPVVVENDATAAVWAEAQLGVGRGKRNVAMVTLGTGVGTGFVLDGKIFRGHNGFAGEAGHMIIEYSGPKHVSGSRGPWEYYASGTGLSRLAKAAARKGDFDAVLEKVGSISSVKGEHVHERVKIGGEQALAVLDDFCRYVAMGVANLVYVLDPELIIIAGGLVDIGEPLLRGIEKWTNRLVVGNSYRPKVDVALAQLGSQAGAVGAALLAEKTLAEKSVLC